MNNDFKFVDLFAGVGGFSLALKDLGGTPVFASEMDPFSQSIYEKNFGLKPAGDISLIEAVSIPDHDVLIGNIPYYALTSRYRTTDSTHQLFSKVMEIIDVKKPKIVILQNVATLCYPNQKVNLDYIIKSLEVLNYSVPDPEILDALDFGVPQRRKCLFIIAFNNESINNPTLFEYPEASDCSARLSDILFDAVDESYTLSDEKYASYLNMNSRYPRFKFINPTDKYAITLLSREFINQPNKNPRRLLIREYARLQGFPDTFIFTDFYSRACIKISISTTVAVAKAVAKAVLDYSSYQEELLSAPTLTIDQQKLIEIFNTNVKGKSPDTSAFNQNHDGKKGHWLERQFNIKANATNGADILGYELKNETTSKTTFGDWSANRYIYKDGPYVNLFKCTGNSTLARQNEFCRMFGKANEEKDMRYSWSGEPVPRIGDFNDFGQKLVINANSDILAIYSFDADKRPDKYTIIPKELQQQELILAHWYGPVSPSNKRKDKCLKEKLEGKFNIQGWFTCKTDQNGFYNEICFGRPITFENWINLIRKGIVIFDSGMYQTNKRPYSQWRASNKFWNELLY